MVVGLKALLEVDPVEGSCHAHHEGLLGHHLVQNCPRLKAYSGFISAEDRSVLVNLKAPQVRTQASSNFVSSVPSGRGIVATAFNAAVENASHAAQHEAAHGGDVNKTHGVAKFYAVISAPITLLTGTLCSLAAYMELQCAKSLLNEARELEEEIQKGHSQTQ
eukprot:gnl/MRDRNA2_/MRDRNA2_33797_c0_seq1.p1 gnl/MRDRNA2_/MRDRNA2_33797_c0~~gnl/MRDRNA2_/MRDRNA2_33797_c0_seq1.p1  ORF type:complete len:163 (+),score=28.52 gnl/MRDRNA2_/MRDRNA2_33797_c0_seq1:77-565(+)